MAIHLSLHDVHARLGARFVESDGYLVPEEYAGAAAEHAALRERAGVIDRSQRGKIEATGRDRVSFLQGMLTSDVKALVAGQGGRAAFLDVHGKVLSLLVVHSLADRLVLEMDRGLVAPTLAGLDRFLISERVELEDASDAHGLLTVAGPEARSTVEKIVGQPVPELRPWHHALLAAEGEPVGVVRNDSLGGEGYDLWVRPEALASWWERATAAGAQPVGQAAWEICRIEAGTVRHGADVTASTLVMEAALDDVYSLNKGCYIGQEVVARVTYRGHVNRKLVGFVFPDARIPAPDAPVRVDGKDVGRITSAVVSPALGHGVALGYLRREHWEPGTRVEVAGDGEPLTAEVAALPFYRRA
jgi:folate-binding protein YgfZ